MMAATVTSDPSPLAHASPTARRMLAMRPRKSAHPARTAAAMEPTTASVAPMPAVCRANTRMTRRTMGPKHAQVGGVSASSGRESVSPGLGAKCSPRARHRPISH